MELHEQIEQVTDEQSFLSFARALMLDRVAAVEAEAKVGSSPYGPDAGGWENISIEDFLESAVAWADDSNFGAKQGLESTNPWKKFAVFLYCGKIYE
ncbi:MAG: hypothetical protein EAZ43_05120 [Betaproteobacteria bacterium]|nr:MAG: hypothetical protein EAZ43_05120 [Betaproteobacteria bacterium]